VDVGFSFSVERVNFVHSSCCFVGVNGFDEEILGRKFAVFEFAGGGAAAAEEIDVGFVEVNGVSQQLAIAIFGDRRYIGIFSIVGGSGSGETVGGTWTVMYVGHWRFEFYWDVVDGYFVKCFHSLYFYVILSQPSIRR
jgi:hypothetical protein